MVHNLPKAFLTAVCSLSLLVLVGVFDDIVLLRDTSGYEGRVSGASYGRLDFIVFIAIGAVCGVIGVIVVAVIGVMEFIILYLQLMYSVHEYITYHK